MPYDQIIYLCNFVAGLGVVSLGFIAAYTLRQSKRVTKVAIQRQLKISEVEKASDYWKQEAFDNLGEREVARNALKQLERDSALLIDAYQRKNANQAKTIEEANEALKLSLDDNASLREAYNIRRDQLNALEAQVKHKAETEEGLLKRISELERSEKRLCLENQSYRATRSSRESEETIQKLQEELEDESKRVEQLLKNNRSLQSQLTAAWREKPSEADVQALESKDRQIEKLRDRLTETQGRFNVLKDCQRQFSSYELKGDQVFMHGQLIGKLKTIHQYGGKDKFSGEREKHIDIIVEL